jgi:long-chain acyl-CoA synthetase
MLKLEDYIADWPDIDYPNFPSWLADIASRWPGNIAMRYRPEKKRDFETWTYRRLASEAERVGRALLGRGLAKGDRVALWAENRPEWCAVWLGAVIAGLVVVPMDFLLRDDEAAGVLSLARPAALFLSRRKAALAARFRAEQPSLAAGLVSLFDGEGPDDFARLGTAAAASTGAAGDEGPAGKAGLVDDALPPLPPASAIAPEDAASIIFTSGTTGLAKGVVLSHHGIIANANASILSLPIYEKDVFMCVLPLHHTYPTTCSFISPLCVGASFTIVEKLVGKVIVDDVRDSGGTIMIAVPLLYDKMRAAIEEGFTAQPAFVRGVLGLLRRLSLRAARHGFAGLGRSLFAGIRAKTGLASLRLLVAGGGPLNPATADFFDSLGFFIVQGYGMSENGPLITTNTMRHKNNASAGLVVKYTELEIRDAGPDGTGEIVVRSPSLMKGYFENPQATATAFTADGFLLTGDLGRLDSDGYLLITGRKKNLIVTGGGKNVYPEEIEACFEGSGVVDAVLVIGRKRRGEAAEEVFAVCQPNLEAIGRDNPGAELSDEFLRGLVKREVEAVNRRLEPYKKIQGFTLRREEFEMTATHKIKRYLYAQYAREYGTSR